MLLLAKENRTYLVVVLMLATQAKVKVYFLP